MLRTFLQDLRYAVRGFRRSPGLVLAAIVSISLGIGANAAIFSVINAVLLQPLSYPDPAQMVRFLTANPEGNGPGVNVPEIALWKAQTDLFEEVAAYDDPGPALNLTSGLFPEEIQGQHVTAGFFRLFGARVVLGRTFTEAEDRPNGGNWAVLSEGLWRRHFSGDPHIVGKSIMLGSKSYKVTGVISSGFRFDTPADVYLPCQFNLSGLSRENQFMAAARLRPGVTIQGVNARLQTLAARYRQELRLTDSHNGFSVQKYRDAVVGDARSSLLLLAGAVAMVLLIACANVANLLLARAAGRHQEIALRAALGASRVRIIRQLLIESVLLALAGGALGFVFAVAGVRALLDVNSGDIPRIGPHGDAVVLDWHLLAFTIAISVGSGVVFGLVPALRASRADIQSVLKSSSARTTDRNHRHILSLFVVGEMGLAVVLVIGTLLMIRTFIALRTVDPGFNSRNVTTMETSVQGTKFEKTAALGQMVQQATEKLQRMPGVEVAAATCSVPLAPKFSLPFTMVRISPQNSRGQALVVTVSPRYFDVFEIPVLRGRRFDDRDRQDTPPVVMVNEAMARKYWPNSDPLGEQIVPGEGLGSEFADTPRIIVGIVRNVHEVSLDQPPSPTMYLPIGQVPDNETALNAEISPLNWVIRTGSGLPVNSRDIEKKLIEATGGLPVGKVSPMDRVVAQSTARTDFTTLLLTIFGFSALALAAVGMYGLMAYSVEQRTQEIGIRMALGAGRLNVRRMIVMQSMKLTLAGSVLGVASAFWLTHFLAGLLFGVQSRDPLVFVIVPLFLSLVALSAAWIPATRATQIAPLEALRQS
jgi:putative ABC transport system permease protein